MQAYTVELEAELDILKQENDKLKQILVNKIDMEDFSSYFYFYFCMINVF